MFCRVLTSRLHGNGILAGQTLKGFWGSQKEVFSALMMFCDFKQVVDLKCLLPIIVNAWLVALVAKGGKTSYSV